MFGTIDLNCNDYEIRAGSIDHGHDGYVFRCTISPVAEDVFHSWLMAVRLGATVRLVFPQRPLLLERVEIHRIDSSLVRVVGRVVAGQTGKGLLG
jgi:hypothetical protein